MFFQSMIIFLRCKEGGRLRHVRFIQGIHIEARIFGTALSHPHQPVHPSRFLRCKGGGERLRHVPFIQGIYIKVRTVLHALSQIHQPTHPSRFLRCKEAGQCGIYVSFKAYTSRYGYFACLDPNPPANSSIAFSCDAKKRGSAAYTFHLRHIHQGTDILHALTQIHQPTHPSRFLAMQRSGAVRHIRFI